MWKSSVFVVLCGFLVSTEAVGFRGFHYEGLEEPVVQGRRLLTEKWIQQPLDHFDVRNNGSWSMRFYESDEFFRGNGPIFIMLGGEWAITPGYLQAGSLYENAKVHGAMMYYTEHRYYGKSKPTPDTSSENLLFLNVDQALADLAFFIETKKKELNIPDAKVIVFGGSYSGNMAAWARVKYPHLILGSLASSAPVRAKADFFEYYEVVANSLKTFDEQCIKDTKAAFEAVDDLLLMEADAEKFKEDFNLCEVPDLSKPTELGWIGNSLAEIFAGVVQYNRIESNGKPGIENLCTSMTKYSEDAPTPYDRLAKLLKSKNSNKCIDMNYDKFVYVYRNVSWESEAAKSIMRLWLYQTCTEYGYYQTTSSPKSMFGSLFPVEFFIQICKDLYGEYYNAQTLDKSVRRTNVMYGADSPDVTNVIFTNGDVDPWHALGVLEDLSKKSPAILVKGSAHCQDLQPERSTDVEGLKEARHKVKSIISSWLNSTQVTC